MLYNKTFPFPLCVSSCYLNCSLTDKINQKLETKWTCSCSKLGFHLLNGFIALASDKESYINGVANDQKYKKMTSYVKKSQNYTPNDNICNPFSFI